MRRIPAPDNSFGEGFSWADALELDVNAAISATLCADHAHEPGAQEAEGRSILDGLLAPGEQ